MSSNAKWLYDKKEGKQAIGPYHLSPQQVIVTFERKEAVMGILWPLRHEPIFPANGCHAVQV